MVAVIGRWWGDRCGEMRRSSRGMRRAGRAAAALCVLGACLPLADVTAQAPQTRSPSGVAGQPEARWHLGGSLGLVGVPDTYWQYATIGVNWSRLAPGRLGGVVELAAFPGFVDDGPYAALVSGALLYPLQWAERLVFSPRAGVTAVAGRPDEESSILIGLHVGADASWHLGRVVRPRLSVTRDHFILEKAAFWRVQLGIESSRGWLARPW